MRICFFAEVDDSSIFNRVNFYNTDIRALRELGHDVTVSSRWRGLAADCNVYFVWWWSHAVKPLMIARLTSRPVIITGVFDYTAPPELGRTRGFYLSRPWWQRWLIAYSVSSANANVFLSKLEHCEVSRAFGLSNSYYIPCGVDTNVYVPGTESRGRFILNVAWSGALNARRKCLREVIEAFAIVRHRHPNLRLVMAGRQGEFHPVLVETARALGISDSVDFVGVISEERKIQLMQRCAAYLQPTLFEGFGLATAEAMACAAAVVTSPRGAVPEVVGDAGLLVDGTDPREIASAIDRLLAEPDLRAEIGARARERIVRQFSYERRKEGIEKIIASVA